jgi:mono/diheme cytochrome c family protein
MTRNVLLIFLAAILSFQCATRNKVTYNIPADYPEARRKQIIELFYKGEELYKTNCSDCHGIFTKGRDKIPNFTSHQLDNYSAKFLRRDPKNHAVAKQMSPEQLNEVLLFLRFKKTKYSDSTIVAQKK